MLEEKRIYLVCYSLRIYKALMEMGQYPNRTMPHPTMKGFQCWRYKRTPELEEIFSALVEEGRKNEHTDL